MSTDIARTQDTTPAEHTPLPLASEEVVLAAPMSFAGSAERIWKLTRMRTETPYRVGLSVLAVTLIGFAWMCIFSWYLVFGLLLVPYRLIRRGQRKRKRQALQHREMLAALEQRELA